MSELLTVTAGYSVDGNGEPTGIDEVTALGRMEVAAVESGLVGWTVTSGFGGWMNDGGALIREPVIIVTSFDVSENVIAKFAVSLRIALGQECVAVAVSPVRYSFI